MPVKRKIQAYCNHIYLQRSQKSKNKRGQLVPNIFARNRKTDFFFFSSLRDSVCCLSLGTQARYCKVLSKAVTLVRSKLRLVIMRYEWIWMLTFFHNCFLIREQKYSHSCFSVRVAHGQTCSICFFFCNLFIYVFCLVAQTRYS